MAAPTGKGLCAAVFYKGIVVGTCVLLNSDGNILYAGPIGTAPIDDGMTVLLSEQDFNDFCERQRQYIVAAQSQSPSQSRH